MIAMTCAQAGILLIDFVRGAARLYESMSRRCNIRGTAGPGTPSKQFLQSPVQRAYVLRVTRVKQSATLRTSAFPIFAGSIRP
jgi:hypothetical protein